MSEREEIMIFEIDEERAWILTLDMSADEITVPESHLGYPVAGFSETFFYEQLNRHNERENEDEKTDIHRPIIHLPKHFEPYATMFHLDTLKMCFRDFTIPCDSTHLAVDQDIVYNKDFTSIVMFLESYKPETTLTFKSSLKKLLYEANAPFEDVQEVVIPKNVSKISTRFHEEGFHGSDYGFFSIFDKLRHISVDQDNQNFVAVDGVLFTKDMKTLIRYPLKKETQRYVIPKETTRILGFAFSHAMIQELAFEEGSACKHIERYAFSNLRTNTLTLPETLESIDKLAFRSRYVMIGHLMVPSHLDHITSVVEHTGRFKIRRVSYSDTQTTTTNRRLSQ